MSVKVVPMPDVAAEQNNACKRLADSLFEEYTEESPAQSVAIAIVRADGTVVSSYHLGGSVFTLAGAIEMLKRRLYEEKVEKFKKK